MNEANLAHDQEFLRQLLAPLELREFLTRFYHCVPYSTQGTAGQVLERFGWDDVARIVESPGVDLVISRGGERLRVPLARGFAQARALFEEGYTIGIRHAEQHHPYLGEIAARFGRVLAGPVDVHVYCTPPGKHGFGWHYDAEEVFIVQVQGAKEFALRKNTVNPFPVVEAMSPGREFHAEQMPMMKCLLQPGDVLYIPSGYWHVGIGSEGECISLAIGVMPTTALTYLDFVKRRLLEDIRWRVRWRVLADSLQEHEELGEQLRAELAALAKQLRSLFESPETLAAFLAERRSLYENDAKQQ